MSLTFGPNNRFVLHIPMTHAEWRESFNRFAQALLAAKPVNSETATPENKQLAFAWSEPMCGGTCKKLE